MLSRVALSSTAVEEEEELLLLSPPLLGRMEKATTTEPATTESTRTRDGEMESAGSWELVIENGQASCVAFEGACDLSMTRQDLSSLYLGAHRAAALSAAGRIEGNADAIALADRVFAWDPAPWCPEVF